MRTVHCEPLFYVPSALPNNSEICNNLYFMKSSQSQTSLIPDSNAIRLEMIMYKRLNYDYWWSVIFTTLQLFQMRETREYSSQNLADIEIHIHFKLVLWWHAICDLNQQVPNRTGLDADWCSEKLCHCSNTSPDRSHCNAASHKLPAEVKLISRANEKPFNPCHFHSRSKVTATSFIELQHADNACVCTHLKNKHQVIIDLFTFAREWPWLLMFTNLLLLYTTSLCQ